MLVLSRKKHNVAGDCSSLKAKESTTLLMIPPSSTAQVVEVKLLESRGNAVRVGFKADKSIRIVRAELVGADQEHIVKTEAIE